MAQTAAKIFVIVFLSLYAFVILGWVAWIIRRRYRISAEQGTSRSFVQRLAHLFSFNRPRDVH